MKKRIRLIEVNDYSRSETDIDVVIDGIMTNATFGWLHERIPEIKCTEEYIRFCAVFDTEDYKEYDFLFSNKYNPKTIEPKLAAMYNEIKGKDLNIVQPIGWYLNACRNCPRSIIEIQ